MSASFVNDNFLELPPRYSNYKTARYVVLPIPYDAAVSYNPGARRAPAAIIDASHHVELLDEELLRGYYKAGVATLDPLVRVATGPKEMHDAIYLAARRIVRDGKTLLGLGGDHSVTGGLVRAVKTRHKRLSVLQIDAHLDLRDTCEGSAYSHATVMRRVTEMGVNVVPVGIRAVDGDELRFAKRNKIEIVTARECHTSDEWVDGVIDRLRDDVYVTIDIDGFDPAYAPGTGTPEPGGLDWYQVTGLLRLVAAERNIVAADVVEVMPLPGQVVTEFLAARLLYKIICHIESEK
ncbi:MAG: agmatinase [Phycisphaerales bacterium]|nr:agmatinase [Phycisphaerales bacterium]